MSKKEKSKSSRRARNTFFALSAGTALLLTGGLMTACDGENGVKVTNVAFYSGEENPTEKTGKVGDFYFETDTCNLWLYGQDGWKVVSQLKGEKGDPGENGQDGLPGTKGADGKDGRDAFKMAKDMGLTQAQTVEEWMQELYATRQGEQGPQGEQGEQGTPGTKILTGNGAPTPALAAIEGDLYIDEDTGDMYKYENDAWGTTPIMNIKGPQGGQGVQGAAGRGIQNFDMSYNEIGMRYEVEYTDNTSDIFMMVEEVCYKLEQGTDVVMEQGQVAGMNVYTFSYYTGVGDETATISFVRGSVSFAQESFSGAIQLHRVSTESEIKAAFAQGGFVQLQSDINAINVTALDASLVAQDLVILDLNGNDLNFTTENSERSAIDAVGEEAYVIVLDSSMAGDGTINNANGCGFLARNGGTVVVKNGEVNAGICFSTNNTLGEGNLVVENGVFNTTQDQPVIYMPAQGMVDISGGEFHGGVYARMGTFNISGGLFTTSADPDTDNWEIQDMYGFNAPLQLGNPIVFYVGSYDFENGNNALNVNISGGKFVNTVNFENGTNALNTMQVYVAGKYEQRTSITVRGGTFISQYGNVFEITDLNASIIDSTETGDSSLQGVPYDPEEWYNGIGDNARNGVLFDYNPNFTGSEAYGATYATYVEDLEYFGSQEAFYAEMENNGVQLIVIGNNYENENNAKTETNNVNEHLQVTM